MENEWMAYVYPSSSSLLNTYSSSIDDVFGGQDCNFHGNTEEAACTLQPPPPYGVNDVAMVENLVSVTNNNNAENGYQEENNSKAKSGDQENNNGVVAAVLEEEKNVSAKLVTELTGKFVKLILINEEEQNKQLLGAEENGSLIAPPNSNKIKNNNDVDPSPAEMDTEVYMELDSLPPAEDTTVANQLMVEDQYKQFLINNNNNNVSDEEDASKNNNVNADAASLATTCISGDVGTASSSRAPRAVWSEEEHKQFLIGLGVDHCNKGKWKHISGEYVPTKSPTQIARHAEKYFNRQDSIHRAATDASVALPDYDYEEKNNKEKNNNDDSAGTG